MKTFYCFLKVSPNPVIGDSLAIGVVYFDGNKFMSFVSPRKKKLLEKLLKIKGVNLNVILKTALDNLEGANLRSDSNELFKKFDQLQSASYFDYLSSYSNGNLQFSEPHLVNKKLTSSDFEKLVFSLFKEEFHPDNKISDTKGKAIERRIEDTLISKVKDQVHTHYVFENSKYDNLFFDFEIDVIGKNGSLIGAKAINFEQSESTVSSNILKYSYLITTLNDRYSNKLEANHFYMIADEPLVAEKKLHYLWESIYKNDSVKVLPAESAGEIADEILANGAKKFLY